MPAEPFLRSKKSGGQLMPRPFGDTMTCRVRCLMPPHLSTSIPPTSRGHASSQSTFADRCIPSVVQGPGDQSVTVQSLTWWGFMLVLYCSSALRTVLTAQMSVKRISEIRSLQLAIFMSNAWERSRCCSSFWREEDRREFSSEVASVSISANWLLCSLRVPIWSFMLSRCLIHSSWLCSIRDVISSTRSLNLPHCVAMVS
mmetsp:Transcript_8389/g.22423  ORF Transcript_8389/g.22423 Transcript_8389/m.22423 type:complete len:200 (+) Transcript_8389:1694-2293(+)